MLEKFRKWQYVFACIPAILGVTVLLFARGVIPFADRRAWLFLGALAAYGAVASIILFYLEKIRPKWNEYRYPVPMDKLIGTSDSPESHTGRDQHALDFVVPEGTEILAPRAGRVLEVKEDSSEGGPDPAFADKANYIIIGHDDGETTYIAHLKEGSARVWPGKVVFAGQLLAQQGSTGWTTEPHVHLAVYQDGVTIPIRFQKYP